MNRFYVVLIGFLLAIANLSLAKESQQEVPRGHMQDLGLHRDSEGHIDILQEIPSAEEFWRKYVSKRTAVLIKGAAKDFPAKSLWTDPYISEKYGHLNVRLESKREGYQYPAGDVSLARDSLKHFVSTYVKENKYIVSQLPKPMYGDVLVPPCLACGDFNDSIVEVNYWMSSGGTRSLLHKDAPNILNCVLNGTKDWILIRPEHEYMVPLAKEPSMDGGGYSVLKVTKVDLIQFSKFRDCPYHIANVSAGDCLYVPYGTLHHVRSYGEKNMAVSFLFSRSLSHSKKFNDAGCEKQGPKNLADSTVAWDFDGATTLTMGLQEPAVYRRAALRAFRGKKNITTKLFMKRIGQTILPEDPQKRREARKKAIENFKLKNKKFITVDEISALPMDAFKPIIFISELDPVNTLQYEYRLFTKDQMREVFREVKDEKGGIDCEQFKEYYRRNLGGSERVAIEVIQEFDNDKDGKISKKERKKNMKRVLNLFEDDMPPEHVNDYADVFVYRDQREQVPKVDPMEIYYDGDAEKKYEFYRKGEGEGIRVKEGYTQFEDGEDPLFTSRKELSTKGENKDERNGDEEEEEMQMPDEEEDVDEYPNRDSRDEL
ncbi:uncharacterized protein TRIADDRAFT_64017 [Trichoplax adhaerens]|uniref:JmjC domain-containing protein n=1 Tax=Trichoplax adhaerens TaxID=10228 RepID=B3RZL6_TRIAD|nr:hypothetical protein TRIADDRAFT_64017 [Trichoplax adhaerens]EDV24231.1 hypothetical protein TRIADDRAFT_64017 [Trichoplax adhaerens]|eukprot:XP_002113757.1 hypothetical protein TRIADDRAFT_64017 [Trichoplax adhaerens]